MTLWQYGWPIMQWGQERVSWHLARQKYLQCRTTLNLFQHRLLPCCSGRNSGHIIIFPCHAFLFAHKSKKQFTYLWCLSGLLIISQCSHVFNLLRILAKHFFIKINYYNIRMSSKKLRNNTSVEVLQIFITMVNFK